ncbi:MAG TPA: hypothetical protein VKG44_00905 [Candidatus Baltobacteraceae bacterium]|nr:hypothetical protein [Candidatus Baltobacteraceae bacterium]
MYLSVLIGVFAIVTVAFGGLRVAAAFALAGERHVAHQYARFALEGARRDLVAQIATQVENGSPDGPFVAPPPSSPAPACPSPAAAAAPPCAFTVSVSVTLDGQTGSASVAPNETGENVQRTSGVSENRVAATLVATLTGPAMTFVARRSLTLRTYAVAPYASEDAAAEATADGTVTGDVGGTCDGAAACGGADTRVHAKLVCSNPDDPSKCAGVADRYVDDFETESWPNAQAVPRNWSP